MAEVNENENTSTYALYTYYVNASTGNDENDGLSADTPFATVDKALSLCGSSLNTYRIYVAAGTYTLNYTTARYAKAISIYGEDYEGDTPSVIFNGSYRLYSTYSIKNIKFDMGIRLYSINNAYKECVFRNCVFTYSSAIGTAVYCFSSTDQYRKTFINCKFSAGTATYSYLYAIRYPQNTVFDNCVFDNVTTSNYAISLEKIGNYYQHPSITFKNMHITDNTFYNSSSYSFSKLKFDNCTFDSATSITKAITSNYYNIPPSIEITNSNTFNDYTTVFTELKYYYNDSLTARLAYAMQTNNCSIVNNKIYSPINGTLYTLKTIDDEEYINILCDKTIYNISSNYSFPILRFYVDNLNPKKISFKIANGIGFNSYTRLTFVIVSGNELTYNAMYKSQNYIGYSGDIVTVEKNFVPEKVGDYYIIFNSSKTLPISGQYTYSFDISKLKVEEV